MASVLPLDKWFKFTSTQDGRDKIYRFIQYWAKLQESRAVDKTVAADYAKLSGAMGMSRKLFRAGKFLNNFDGALAALKDPAHDPLTRVCIVGRNTFLGLWLLQDMAQWLHSVNFIKIADIKTMNKRVFQCWLIGLIFGIVLSLHKLRSNAAQLAQANKRSDQATSSKLQAARTSLAIDLTSQVLDLVLPGSGLEYISVSGSTVGIIGAITSLIQAYQLWPTK